MHYLLFYNSVPRYAELRIPLREAHLAHAIRSFKRGDLVLGGALADPVDGAVLLFRADSPQVAEDFAKNDPYVVNGLVLTWQVRPWMTVVGELAEVSIPETSTSDS